MICGSCNREIPDGSVNCPNCGAPTMNAQQYGTQQYGTQVPMGSQGNAAKKFFDQQSDTVNWIALAIAALGALSVFLAKVTLKVAGIKFATCAIVFGKIKLVDGGGTMPGSDTLNYGLFMIIFFVLSAIFIFLKKNNNALTLTVINAVFALFKLIQESTSKDQILGMTIKSVPNAFFWLVFILALAEAAVLVLMPKLLQKN